jgi:hypothetical protein
MDIGAMWRNMRMNPTDAPRPGTHRQTEGPGISISVTQECLIALPPRTSRIPEVSVTITSNRPGVPAQVSVGANFNTPDGSYQGPTTTVGTGQFTATISQINVRFIVLPSGFPVLGVGAASDWADGEHSATLTYEQIACDPWVWWGWLNPVVGILSRTLSGRTDSRPRRGRVND